MGGNFSPVDSQPVAPKHYHPLVLGQSLPAIRLHPPPCLFELITPPSLFLPCQVHSGNLQAVLDMVLSHQPPSLSSSPVRCTAATCRQC